MEGLSFMLASRSLIFVCMKAPSAGREGRQSGGFGAKVAAINFSANLMRQLGL
jgi:hypothetical protein